MPRCGCPPRRALHDGEIGEGVRVRLVLERAVPPFAGVRSEAAGLHDGPQVLPASHPTCVIPSLRGASAGPSDRGRHPCGRAHRCPGEGASGPPCCPGRVPIGRPGDPRGTVAADAIVRASRPQRRAERAWVRGASRAPKCVSGRAQANSDIRADDSENWQTTQRQHRPGTTQSGWHSAGSPDAAAQPGSHHATRSRPGPSAIRHPRPEPIGHRSRASTSTPQARTAPSRGHAPRSAALSRTTTRHPHESCTHLRWPRGSDPY